MGDTDLHSGRQRRGRTRLLGLALAAGALGAAVPLATSTAGAAARGIGSRSAATCTRPGISAFAFKPETVIEGKRTMLSVGVVNCTNKRFSGSLELYGVFACLVLDPVMSKVDLGPHSGMASLIPYMAPKCAGPGKITGRLLTAKGKAISTKFAKVNVVAPPASRGAG